MNIWANNSPVTTLPTQVLVANAVTPIINLDMFEIKNKDMKQKYPSLLKVQFWAESAVLSKSLPFFFPFFSKNQETVKML